jgi:hypothetical protein
MSSGVLAGNNESILASSEYGDDGIIPVSMKQWLNKSDTGLNYPTTPANVNKISTALKESEQ